MKDSYIKKFFKSQSKLIKRIILVLNDTMLVFTSLIISSFIINENYNILNSTFFSITLITVTLFYYKDMHNNVIKNIGLRYIYTSMRLTLSIFFIFSFIIGFIFKNIILSKVVFI